MIARLLSGRYRIEAIVGTGGMAVVYRAVDVVEDKVVAIKVLRPEFETDEEFVRRFRAEAVAASRMFHENIVSVLDVGIDGETRYIVMEYVEGQTLKAMIRSEGKIHPDVALRMTIRILAAVDHAHRNDFVHRDIKPQNILVDRDGQIKVADFGIARLKTEKVEEEGKAFGSVHYFSPEQAKGEPAGEQSDLYSVGIVMYEMLSGKVPFEGETPITVALKHVNERPESLQKRDPAISKALDEVVMRALAKDRAMRYQSAAEMAADLRKTITNPEGGFVHYPESISEETEASGEGTQSKETAEKKGTQQRKPKPAVLKMRKHIKHAVLYGFIGLAAMFLVIGGLYYLITHRVTEMPALVGLEERAAIDALNEAELKPVVVNAYSDEFPIGAVMLQSEEAGAQLRVDTSVTVTVSLGTQWYDMPDLYGWQVTDAEEVLENAAVAQYEIKYVMSSMPEGQVVSTNIPEGKTSRDTPVILLVSGKKVRVPDLLGLDRETAEAVLKAEGLTVGAVYESTLSDARPGTVIYQSAPANGMTLSGSTVLLAVCKERTSSYAPSAPLMIVVPMDNIRTVIQLYTPEGQEVTVYTGRPPAGSHRIGMTSKEKGIHEVRVYMDDILYETLYINFD